MDDLSKKNNRTRVLETQVIGSVGSLSNLDRQGRHTSIAANAWKSCQDAARRSRPLLPETRVCHARVSVPPFLSVGGARFPRTAGKHPQFPTQDSCLRGLLLGELSTKHRRAPKEKWPLCLSPWGPLGDTPPVRNKLFLGSCKAPKGTNTKATSAKGHFCDYPTVAAAPAPAGHLFWLAASCER